LNREKIKRVKVAFIGEGNVGKTTLANALANEVGDVKMTIGVDIHVLNSKELSMIIFDLSGQERFQFLRDFVLKNAKLVCYIFDVSEPATLYSLLNYPVVISHKILVGNKIDLGMKVKENEVKVVANYLEANKIFYTSAIRYYGVKELLTYMLKVVRTL